jgi:hypothetical protein
MADFDEADDFDKVHGHLLEKRKAAGTLSDKMGRGATTLLRVIFAIIVFLAVAKAWDVIAEKDKREEAAREFYLRNLASPQQRAANEHFSKCAQYRRTSSAVWSERQKYYALLGEGCHSDDRDDPRYPEATYPWNDYKPW